MISREELKNKILLLASRCFSLEELKCWNNIVKDLEVLEILKNVLCFRIQLYDVHSDGSYKSYEFLDVKDDINSLENKKKYKIIKQWLEEDSK